MIYENCKNCKYFSNGFLNSESEFEGIFYCKYMERIYTDLHACMNYQVNSRSEE